MGKTNEAYGVSNITYDRMGNLQTMNRNGKTGANSWDWKLQQVSQNVAFAAEKYFVYNYYQTYNRMPYAQNYPYNTGYG